MKRLTTSLVLVILLAGLVPMAVAQGPAGTTPETVAAAAGRPAAAPAGSRPEAMRILDNFNRADGPLGPRWTVRGGTCSIVDGTAVCDGYGRATLNDYSGDGDAAEADVAVVGTDLQYTGLLLNYGAGVNNLFLKVQQQEPYSGQFTHAACYTGNNSAGFGLGFFPLDAPFQRAHMKAIRVGDDVTISFTNVDNGAQPDQTYLCTGAPPREGTGIGILGLNGIARLDNFGVPAHPPLNGDGLLYMTSLDIGETSFAVYNPVTDAWTTLTPYETGCRMAVDADGRLLAHNYHLGTIDRYDPAADTWTPIMAGPPGASGQYCNLEITDGGEFLYTEWNNTTLWYTSGGVWNTLALPFATNVMGDYDPTTDQYVIGEAWTTNAHLIDVHTWTITDFLSTLPNGERARFGVVLGNRYYFEAAGSNVHSFDLGNPALPPLDHGVSPGWYTSAAADRFHGVIYSASLDGTALNLFDPATNALTPLTGYGTATWHSSLTFVPGPAIEAQMTAPAFAETGTVISYTIVISAPVLAEGMFMVDSLPSGVEFDGNLAWSDGLAWYDSGSRSVRWEYHSPKTSAPPPAAPRPAVYDPESVADRVGGAGSPAPAPVGTVATWSHPEAVLWDNGPLVTHPGDCAGMDASRLQTGLGMNTYGFGHQVLNGNRMADDFEITDPAGWNIDTITFFAYQTNGPTDPSPITAVNYQIWDGPPNDPGSSVVFGDTSTNRLLSSTFTNIQRDSETGPCTNERYIFADVCSAGVLLPPGVYWLDWQTDGTLSSGPWAPPITILGQTTTGNALQYTTSSGAWNPALDSGTSTQQGMPFVIEGSLGEPARVEISFDAALTAPCGAVIVNEGIAGRGPLVRPLYAATEVWGHPRIDVHPSALEAVLLPDTTAVRALHICNTGACPLHWELFEAPPPLARTGMPFAPVDVTGPAANPGLTPASPHVRPGAVPSAAPEDVLWDQPLSTVNQAAYVDQEFTDYPAYSSFLADDFTNAEAWLVERLFIPGDGWNGFSTLLNATALTWQIYADCGGVPCGDPSGGGAPPVWSLTLPPNHPLVTLSPGTPGGMPSNVLLRLSKPGVLPPGTWWLVFYPTIQFIPNGQYGRQPADTTNGHTAQFINPGGGFGYGTNWQDWTVIGPAQQDIAFRIEGITLPLVDIPWLSESPISGTVPSGCATVDVTFDAAGLALGDYSASLLTVSDDRGIPLFTVPVSLAVVDRYAVYLPILLRQ